MPELRLLIEGTGGQQQAGGGAAAVATAMHAPRRIFDYSAASRTEVSVAAAEAGRLSCLEFLRGLQGWVGRGASDTECNMEVLQAAARSGSVPVLEWVLDVLLREASPPLSPLVATAAAGSGALGSVEVLTWLRRRGCQWNAFTFAAAVGTRDIGLLEWLWAERCPRDGDMAYAAAVAAGQELDSDGQLGGVRRFGGGGSWCRNTVVRALTSDGVGVSSSSGGGGGSGGRASCGGACAGAGGVSRVALLEWLHTRGVLPADAGACFAAAAVVGDQTVLEWWAAKGWSLGVSSGSLMCHVNRLLRRVVLGALRTSASIHPPPPCCVNARTLSHSGRHQSNPDISPLSRDYTLGSGPGPGFRVGRGRPRHAAHAARLRRAPGSPHIPACGRAPQRLLPTRGDGDG